MDLMASCLQANITDVQTVRRTRGWMLLSEAATAWIDYPANQLATLGRLSHLHTGGPHICIQLHRLPKINMCSNLLYFLDGHCPFWGLSNYMLTLNWLQASKNSKTINPWTHYFYNLQAHIFPLARLHPVRCLLWTTLTRTCPTATWHILGIFVNAAQMGMNSNLQTISSLIPHPTKG